MKKYSLRYLLPTAIITGFLMFIALSPTDGMSEAGMFARSLALWFGSLGAFVTVLLVAWFAVEVGGEAYRNYRTANAITPEVRALEERHRLVQSLALLGPDVIEFLAHNREMARSLTGMSNPLIVLERGDLDYTYEFLDDFFDHCDSVHLAPRSRYAEGSRNYQRAQAFTRELVDKGFAIDLHGRGGPYPARWTSSSSRALAEQEYYGERVNNLRAQDAE